MDVSRAARLTPPAVAAPVQPLECDTPSKPSPRATLAPEVAVAPAYFRTYEAVRAEARAMAEKHPGLVRVLDVGPSTDTAAGKADRPLFALEVGKRPSGDGPDTRPTIAMIAGVHAREIANPELGMRTFAQWMDAYGTDAQITHLMDTTRIVFVPIANPDGHFAVETGYATNNSQLLWQRKNSSTGGGVDINRNFDFHWGEVGGSKDPKSETYMGPSAASEAETKSIQSFLTAQKPTMVLDWHSSGGKVLVPFGHTGERPVDDVALRAVGEQFKLRNGYHTMNSWDFGSGGATLKDWAYGRLGALAFTVETGTDFHQKDAQFADTMAKNASVFRYTAAIAADPKQLSLAPSADAMTLDAATGAVSAQLRQGAGRAGIAAAELVLDASAAPGSGTPLAAADGAFGGASEVVSGAIPAAARDAAAGAMAYIRGKSADGVWGPLVAAWRTPKA